MESCLQMAVIYSSYCMLDFSAHGGQFCSYCLFFISIIMSLSLAELFVLHLIGRFAEGQRKLSKASIAWPSHAHTPPSRHFQQGRYTYPHGLFMCPSPSVLIDIRPAAARDVKRGLTCPTCCLTTGQARCFSPWNSPISCHPCHPPFCNPCPCCCVLIHILWSSSIVLQPSSIMCCPCSSYLRSLSIVLQSSCFLLSSSLTIQMVTKAARVSHTISQLL